MQAGHPWENGYVESFNGKLRDELLNGEIFYTLRGSRGGAGSTTRSGPRARWATAHRRPLKKSRPKPLKAKPERVSKQRAVS